MESTPELYAAAVAATLRAERGARQMSYKELSEASGVTEQSLLRYMNGKRDIPLPVLFQIAAGLNISMRELISRAEARLVEEG